MTQLEQYIEKGFQKGVLLGNFQVTQNLLKMDCEWEFITEITGINEDQFQELSKQISSENKQESL